MSDCGKKNITTFIVLNEYSSYDSLFEKHGKRSL